MLGRRELTGEEASYEASLYPWYSLWILKAGAFDLIPNNPKLGRIHGLSPAAILLQPYMAWSLIIPSGAE